MYLSRFDFILKYITESKIGKADRLSRRPDWEMGVKRDNKEQTLIKKKWLEAKRIRIAEVIIERVDLLDNIMNHDTRTFLFSFLFYF